MGVLQPVYCVESRSLRATPGPAIKAIAFDGFTTFDPQSVSALAEKLFPGRGAELSNVLRTRQFEYTWLRTVCGRYADFWKATEDALVFAAKTLKLELSVEQQQQQLMQAYLELKSYPDVLPALKSLRQAGIRLAFLSNMTPHMLDSAIKISGLEGVFEASLSTDRVRVYKPDPRAYQMAMEAFMLKAKKLFSPRLAAGMRLVPSCLATRHSG